MTRLPHAYREPRWLPSGRLETCRGVVIGGAIAPAKPALTRDGVLIQAALLDPRTARRQPWWRRIVSSMMAPM